MIRRIAHVRAPDGDAWVTHGSGYLVSPHLVLTSGHLRRPGMRVELPYLAGGRPLPAQPVWHRQDGAVDATLLRLPPDALSRPPALPPLRWGRLVTDLPDCPVSAVGFPRTQRTPEHRDTQQLSARIHPGTGVLRRRYELLSADSTAPVTLGAEGTPWSGMSGAAVFHREHRLLLGLVCADRQPTSGTLLTATRAEELLADERFRALVEEDSGTDALLEPAELAGLCAPLAPERRAQSPAWLLRAEAEVLPYSGRERERDQLRAWCEGEAPEVSVRILTGAGGTGKSRLARLLVRRMHDAGWVAAQLQHRIGSPYGPSGADDFALFERVRDPLLLVMDYAEGSGGQMRDFLRRVLEAGPDRRKVRLLLIARSTGAWNTDPMGADARVRAVLSQAPVIELGAVTSPGESRLAAYEGAVRLFAAELDRLPGYPAPADDAGEPTRWARLAPAIEAPADLAADDTYDVALNLQMAALVALLRRGGDESPAEGAVPLEHELLSHELSYWERAAPLHGVSLRGEELERAVAVGTLCGAGSRAEALATVDRLPELPEGTRSGVALLLRALYPPASGGFWGRVQPDLVAEYLGWKAVRSHEDFLPSLFSGASPEQQRQLLTDLVRAALAHARAGRTDACAALLDQLEQTLDGAEAVDTEALHVSYLALPYEAPVLYRFARAMARRLRDGYREQADAAARGATGLPGSSPEQRRRLAHLAWACQQFWSRSSVPSDMAGDLAAIREAVRIRRALADEEPLTYLPELASSLHQLGYAYFYSDLLPLALTASAEAVRIRRSLAARDPETHEPELAGSLHNLAIDEREAGRRTAARQHLEEAVRIKTRLAERDAARHGESFARSLAVLSQEYADQDHRPLALAAAQGAVRHYRAHARRDPLAGQSPLAWSLGVLASRQTESHRWTAAARQRYAAARPVALSAAEEAVGIGWRLARQDPGEFRPRLANALADLSDHFRHLGLHDKALLPARESVHVWWLAANTDPRRYAASFAGSFFALSKVYRAQGDLPHALAAIRRCVALWRRLPDVDAEPRQRALAEALWEWSSVLGACATRADDRSFGVPQAQEATEIYRRIDGTRSWRPGYAPYDALNSVISSTRRSESRAPRGARRRGGPRP